MKVKLYVKKIYLNITEAQVTKAEGNLSNLYIWTNKDIHYPGSFKFYHNLFLLFLNYFSNILLVGHKIKILLKIAILV